MNDMNDINEYDRLEDFGRMKVYHHEAPHGEREDPDGLLTKIFFPDKLSRKKREDELVRTTPRQKDSVRSIQFRER